MAPNEVLYVKPSIRKGMLPKMLEEVLNARILIKNELKFIQERLQSETQPISRITEKRLKALKRQLDILQLGLKYIANFTYGYTSANFTGRMPCIEIADSIVAKGRSKLEQTIEFIDEWGIRSGTNLKVIYGDTDSLFVIFPKTSVNDAFQIADFLLKEINKRQPYPILLKLEKIYKQCIIVSKKRYCGLAYESPKQSQPIFDAKGIETVRRDSCTITAKIIEKSLRILFESKDPGEEPKSKERIPYVIIDKDEDDSGRKQHIRVADKVKEPFDLLRDRKLQIDANYYCRNVIIPPLARLLESVHRNALNILNRWLQEVCDSHKKINVNVDRNYLSNIDYICRANIFTEKWRQYCSKNPRKIFTRPSIMIGNALKANGRKLKHLEQICSQCTGIDLKIIGSIFEKDNQNIDAGRWPKCMVETCSILYLYEQIERDFVNLAFLNRVISYQANRFECLN
ncbi:DNA polymerase-like protein [Sarcoptes scabiei]|uniref:DNA-directed DNA polymerase n=1 Tax=Sarcoptes scabiei TaxID=52283 RepID=A0A131ZYK9_SARSC|nr:DNA polymerase-like protein [Sarcoptes scabiei]